MAKITNAQVNTLAAAVASPYGPLVRVTNMDDLPDPNADIKIHFTTAVAGVEVDATYNEMNDADVQAAIIAQAFNEQADIQGFKAALATYATAVAAMTLPHTYADYKTIYNGLSTLARSIGVVNA